MWFFLQNIASKIISGRNWLVSKKRSKEVRPLCGPPSLTSGLKATMLVFIKSAKGWKVGYKVLEH